MRILFLTIILFSLGCNLGKQVVKENKSNIECEQYFEFLKKNWMDDGDYLFRFNGNPKYWKENEQIYFKGKCLKGLSKEEIIALLGEPTRSAKVPRFGLDFATYCMQDSCLLRKTISGLGFGGVSFDFDKDGKLEIINVHPPLK